MRSKLKKEYSIGIKDITSRKLVPGCRFEHMDIVSIEVYEIRETDFQSECDDNRGHTHTV